MAWIESHQEIAHHPKTRKLARRLDISIPEAVGHLHCLWHWALSYADDGDLSEADNEDVAIGAMWEGEPDVFVTALEVVGYLDETRYLHNWWKYTGKLVERRKANAERMRQAREAHEQTTKPKRAKAVPRTSEARSDLCGATVPNQTKPDPTQPKPLSPSGDFEDFWKVYPQQPNGTKPDRVLADKQWGKLKAPERERALVGAAHYQAACASGTFAKHAHRWLRDRTFEDWQAPATAASPNGRGGHKPYNDANEWGPP